LLSEKLPNWTVVEDRLGDTLRRTGRGEVRMEQRMVATHEQAEAVGFIGSPTAGSPTFEQIFEALS